jgi:hypothetical protein
VPAALDVPEAPLLLALALLLLLLLLLPQAPSSNGTAKATVSVGNQLLALPKVLIRQTLLFLGTSMMS